MEGQRGRGEESRKKQSLGGREGEGRGMVKKGEGLRGGMEKRDWRNARFSYFGTAIPIYHFILLLCYGILKFQISLFPFPCF